MLKDLLITTLLCIFSQLALADCLNNKNTSIEPKKPDSLYIEHHGRGVVSDKATGLMWQKCEVGYSGNQCDIDDNHEGPRRLRWLAAVQEANDNSSFGYDDWRLPNIKELQSLIESACFNPAVNDSIFPVREHANYWTSTPDIVDGSKVWVINLGSGQESTISKESVLPLMLVR